MLCWWYGSIQKLQGFFPALRPSSGFEAEKAIVLVCHLYGTRNDATVVPTSQTEYELCYCPQFYLTFLTTLLLPSLFPTLEPLTLPSSYCKFPQRNLTEFFVQFLIIDHLLL